MPWSSLPGIAAWVRAPDPVEGDGGVGIAVQDQRRNPYLGEVVRKSVVPNAPIQASAGAGVRMPVSVTPPGMRGLIVQAVVERLLPPARSRSAIRSRCGITVYFGSRADA